MLIILVLEECEAFLLAIGATVAMVDAFHLAKAYSLLWACCNAEEPFAGELWAWNDAFFKTMPEDAFLRFVRHPCLYPDVARYALHLRGINPKLFRMVSGLGGRLARLFKKSRGILRDNRQIFFAQAKNVIVRQVGRHFRRELLSASASTPPWR